MTTVQAALKQLQHWKQLRRILRKLFWLRLSSSKLQSLLSCFWHIFGYCVCILQKQVKCSSLALPHSENDLCTYVHDNFQRILPWLRSNGAKDGIWISLTSLIFFHEDFQTRLCWLSGTWCWSEATCWCFDTVKHGFYIPTLVSLALNTSNGTGNHYLAHLMSKNTWGNALKRCCAASRGIGMPCIAIILWKVLRRCHCIKEFLCLQIWAKYISVLVILCFACPLHAMPVRVPRTAK